MVSEMYQRGDFQISTDQDKLDIDFIHDYLCNQSYWAQGRTREAVEKSIEHSLCFGVYERKQQVGFARVVTDFVTLGWLCDVFITDSHQGYGLGKWLIECVVAHPFCKLKKASSWQLEMRMSFIAGTEGSSCWQNHKNGCIVKAQNCVLPLIERPVQEGGVVL